MLAASQLLLPQPRHLTPINPLAASAPELCGGSLIETTSQRRRAPPPPVASCDTQEKTNLLASDWQPRRRNRKDAAFRLGAFAPKGGEEEKLQVFLELSWGGQDMWFSFRSRSANNSQNKTSVPFEEGPRTRAGRISLLLLSPPPRKKKKKISEKTSSAFE